MADSTDPPTGDVIPFPSVATDPPATVYVCGETNGKCVCIENHHGIVKTEKTWHVCYQCGDEWETK